MESMKYKLHCVESVESINWNVVQQAGVESIIITVTVQFILYTIKYKLHCYSSCSSSAARCGKYEV